jgi:hypothetical protein
VIKEVAIPNLKRGGGLNNSKLISNPKIWLRSIKAALKYFKDEELRLKLKSFESKLKSKFKI